MSTYAAELKERLCIAEERIAHLEDERDWYGSLVNSFDTGEQCGSSLKHRIYAQWGQRRIAERSKQPALLSSGTCQ